jgi:hypothetical protein
MPTKQKVIYDNFNKYFEKGKLNTFTYNEGVSPEHNKKIAELFCEYRSIGDSIVVRGTLKKEYGGGSPDLTIISVNNCFIVEVLKTETEKRFNEKNYPFYVKKVRI